MSAELKASRDEDLAMLRRAFEDGAPLSASETIQLRHANAKCMSQLAMVEQRAKEGV